MKKKLVVTLILLAMIFVASCGGSKKEDPAEGQDAEIEELDDEYSDVEEFDEEDLTAPEPAGEYIELKDAGLKLKAPETYLNNQDKMYLYALSEEIEEGFYYALIYLYPDTYVNLMNMSDEDYEEAESNAVNLLTVIKTNTLTEEEVKTWLKLSPDDEDPDMEHLGNADGYDVYALRDKEVPEGIKDELKPLYENILKEMESSINTMEHFEPISQEDAVIGSSLSFKTTTVNGEEVTAEDLFSGNKITAVNFWASWCGPCVGEMPELEELNKEWQEKGGAIVGVLMDANEGTGLTDGLDIISDTGVTYTNIAPCDEILEVFQIRYFPTTFFIDSNGQVVGEPVIGADIEEYKRIMNELLG